MNVHSKNRSRICCEATALCCIAFHSWAGQGTVDQDPERIIAEAPSKTSHELSTDSMNPGQQGAPALTPVKQASTHPAYPGLDHPDDSHQIEPNPVDGAIDACSLRCLSCHDGISATETRIKTAGKWEMPFDTHRYFHPLGVSYDAASSGDSALTPRAFLPPQIILPEGKVGCESCHDLRSSMPHFLVTSTLGGALCLECHIK